MPQKQISATIRRPLIGSLINRFFIFSFPFSLFYFLLTSNM